MTSLSGISNLNNLMAQRLFAEHSRAIAQISERLATGKRINHAKDDPSGLIVATGLEAEAASIRAELESGSQLSGKLAVMDGYYSALADLAIDLEGTVVAASSGSGLSQAEREAYQIEADSIIKAMDFIYSTATFKGERLFTEGLDLSTGRSFEHIALIQFKDLGSTLLRPRGTPGPGTTPADPQATGGTTGEEPPEAFSGTLRDLMTGGRLNLVDGDLEGAQAVAKAAHAGLARQWAQIGNQMRRIDSHNRSLAAQLEGNQGVYSQIMDTDYAKETSALMREQVLQQASIFVLKATRDMQAKALGLLLGR